MGRRRGPVEARARRQNEPDGLRAGRHGAWRSPTGPRRAQGDCAAAPLRGSCSWDGGAGQGGAARCKRGHAIAEKSGRRHRGWRRHGARHLRLPDPGGRRRGGVRPRPGAGGGDGRGGRCRRAGAAWRWRGRDQRGRLRRRGPAGARRGSARWTSWSTTPVTSAAALSPCRSPTLTGEDWDENYEVQREGAVLHVQGRGRPHDGAPLRQDRQHLVDLGQARPGIPAAPTPRPRTRCST